MAGNPLLPLLAALALPPVSAAGGPPPAPGPAARFLARMPEHIVLAAPYTPFRRDGSLNASGAAVDLLAAQAAQFGVNTVWVPGSMAQFDALTAAERRALLEAWVPAAKARGMYVIAHVGATAVGEAAALAAHAARVGADAVASVPNFYERTSDVDDIVDWLAPISAAAPDLPFFYYHIPALTGAEIKVSQLFAAAAAAAGPDAAPRLPNLAGVKFVSSDLADWVTATAAWNASRALLFAPEPKLASFGLGFGRGTVLAQDFFAPTYLRMRRAWYEGRHGDARAEQRFKLAATSILSRYGSSVADQALYRRFPLVAGRFAYGPPRLPKRPFDEAAWPRLDANLTELGFWAQLLKK